MLPSTEVIELACFYRDKNIVITGGQGFVGQHLREALRVLGARVQTFDIKERFDRDVTRLERVQAALDDSDIVFHLAAQTEVGKSIKEPYKTYMTNVVGTLNVLEVCHSLQVPKVIVASTDKVYGPYDHPGSILEHTRFRDTEHNYGQSKQLADELCWAYRSIQGLDVRVLRATNIYGPGQKNRTTLMTNTITRYLDGLPPILFTPDVSREYLFVRDVVDAYVLVGTLSKEETDFAYNVGSGDRLWGSEVIERLLLSLGGNPTEYDRDPCAILDYNQGVDSSLFRSRFPKWMPVAFDVGVDLTISWHKENHHKLPKQERL